MALNWLVEVSPWTHWPSGEQTLREMLLQDVSLVWVRRQAIHAALICSLFRLPVATVRLLTWREKEDRGPFFDCVLPAMERLLTARCAHWLSLHRCEPWLVEDLLAHGYQIQDQVLNYHKRGLHAPVPGNGQVLVRGATPVDQESLAALDAACFEPYWRLNQEIIRCALRISAYALVATEGEAVVGYLLAEQWENEAYISRVGVSPAARGRGIGTRLLVEAFRLMERDGLAGVRLNTQEDNRESRAVYERLGFVCVGEPETIWTKTLSAIAPLRGTGPDMHKI